MLKNYMDIAISMEDAAARTESGHLVHGALHSAPRGVKDDATSHKVVGVEVGAMPEELFSTTPVRSLLDGQQLVQSGKNCSSSPQYQLARQISLSSVRNKELELVCLVTPIWVQRVLVWNHITKIQLVMDCHTSRGITNRSRVLHKITSCISP